MNTQNRYEDLALGMLVNDDMLFFKYHSRISPKVFYQPLHRKIMGVYQELIKKSVRPDVVSLGNGLEDSELQALQDIVTSVDFDAHFENIWAKLEENYQYTELSSILVKVNSRIKEGEEPDKIKAFLNREITSLEINTEAEDSGIGSHLNKLFASLQQSIEGTKTRGMQTGIKVYDDYTGGIYGTDLVVIAGRTSQGKTSLALNIARYLAKSQSLPGAIFSLEMSSEQLATRFASMESGVDSNKIYSGRINQVELQSMITYSDAISKSPIIIDRCKSTSLEYILNSIRKYSFVHNVKWVVVDYIQLVNSKQQSREQEIGHIARSLKNIAIELNISVIALSQLRRPEDKKFEPSIFDLRDSGQIEEAADTIMMPYRPEHYAIEYFEDGSSTEGMAEILITKGRNSGIFRFRMQFTKQLTEFKNVDAF